MLNLILAAALSAQTVDPATEADLRCLAALAVVVTQVDETEKDGIAAGMFLFAGRIEGRSPDFDLESGVRRIFATVSGAALRQELPRCGELMKARGESFMAMGQRLQSDPPKP